MADLSLDLSSKSSPNYGDLLFIDNDLVLTSDVNPMGTNPVLQDILTRLAWVQGEWFLNVQGGIPYFQQIFVKNQSLSKINAIFFAALAATPGVTLITYFSITLNNVTRLLTLSFACQTTSGPVNYQGTVPFQ
jgi:hypothetical protein